MELEIGIVCGRCESYAALGATTCPSLEPVSALGAQRPLVGPLQDRRCTPPTTVSRNAPVGRRRSPGREPRPFVARATSTSLGREEANGSSPPGSSRASRPLGHDPVRQVVVEAEESRRGAHGSSQELRVPFLFHAGSRWATSSAGGAALRFRPEIMNARTQFFGQLQAPGKAKLILIRGEGVEGLSYQLNAEQHVVGRSRSARLPRRSVRLAEARELLLSQRDASRPRRGLAQRRLPPRARHASTIAARAITSSPASRSSASTAPPKLNDQPGPTARTSTRRRSTRARSASRRSSQGGAHGMTVCARGSSLQIGREGGDLNFPSDLYMSGSHCKIEESSGKLTLTDLNSRNGTLRPAEGRARARHGDYLFIGRKLLARRDHRRLMAQSRGRALERTFLSHGDGGADGRAPASSPSPRPSASMLWGDRRGSPRDRSARPPIGTSSKTVAKRSYLRCSERELLARSHRLLAAAHRPRRSSARVHRVTLSTTTRRSRER